MTFLRYFNILLIELFLIALPIGAQTVSPAETDSLTLVSDTIAADSISPNPEWYVAPEIPVFLRAPRRAPAAASCPLDSILTFNIDSVLVEVTIYGYDNAGHTINQEVWTVNADGSRIGKEKKEYAYTGSTQTMTAVYAWDNNTNNWKGTEKSEFTYAGGRMTSNTSYVWLNAAWVADLRYTYSYDAAGRDATYYEYRRNTSTNQLEPYKGFVYVWIDNTQKSLEENYTTYSNGAWNGGTKKEWAFDAEGRQTLYSYYGTIKNGQWVGSQKETWAYEGPSGQLTLHEQYGWYNNDWSMTLREKTGYDEAEHLILIENYTGANGVTTGVKKEEYTYDGDILTTTIKYAWSDGAWIGSQKETWVYGGPAGELTLHEQFGWANNDWSMTLKEETEYEDTHIVRIENYTYANGVPTGTKKETWTFNNAGKQTLHEEFGWENNDWSKILKEETEYEGNNIVRIENYTYANGVTTGTKKEEYAYTLGKKTQTIIYSWEGSAWVENTKEVFEYTSGKQILHEQYEYSGGNWTITLQENTAYDGSNISKIENYALIEGVWIGTKKEETIYVSGLKTRFTTYTWSETGWINATLEIWSPSIVKPTLHEKYNFVNNVWSITLQEKTTYDGENIVGIENYVNMNDYWIVQKEDYVYSNGQMTQRITYALLDNEWVYSTKAVAGYQYGNTIVSATNYTWDGSAWVGLGSRTFTTFEGEKITQLLTQNWPEGATDWTDYTRCMHTYNADGIEILTHNASWNGTQWTMTSMARTDIIIDEKGRQLLNASWTCEADSAWKGVHKDTAAYSATDKLIYVAQYNSWANNDWVPYSKLENTYDAADRPILSMQYEGKNGVWVNKSKTEQVYDDHGNRILNQSFTWVRNAWAGVYKYEYAYDEAGHQTMQAQYNWSANKWRGVSRSESIFDDEGYLICSMSYSWRNNTWVGSMREEYVYDAQKRVVDYILKIWESNDWINYRRTTYGFDHLGQTISTHQYWWYNEQWALYGLEDKEYDLADNKLRREISASWLNNVLQSYTNKNYLYSCDTRYYTIRFVNYDGTLLASAKWEEGQTPAYGGETPTRPADAQYTYTYTGWNNPITAATADATYTATYSSTVNQYTITFLNEDSTELQTSKVDYGQMPAYNGETPTKAATDQYTYIFDGWDQQLVTVTGDATYIAIYSSTVNSYTITWRNWDNSIIDQTIVQYGATPSHDDAVKDNTAEWTYTFAGWEPEVVSVVGDATYTAMFDSVKNSYTITWRNWDLSSIDQTSVEYGVTPTHDDAVKDNTSEWTYTFSGWDPEIVSIVGDATYTAMFDSVKNSYTITWRNDDGTEIDHETLEYGVTPTHDDAVKDNTSEWTYTFSGWDPAIVSVVGDATYTAMFDSVKNSYTITWRNDDGTEIDHETLEYGVTPAHDDATKENTAEWTYSFAGWDPAIVAVMGDATYTAKFDSTKNAYTITWLNWDNSQIDQTSVDYGTTPTHVDATREATAEWTYTFTTWDPEIVDVVGDATYTAQFDSTKNSYTITWLNADGSEIEHETLEYGATPEHVDIVKEATTEWTYSFLGWEPEITTVTGDANYKAIIDSTKNSYTVTWLNADGLEIEHETLEYGATPEHADIDKEATAEWTYSFTGWDPAIVDVIGDAFYKATFDSVKNSYIITWLNADGSEIEHETLEYGATPAHADIIKENTDEWTYTFAGWDPELTAVIGDASYTATFDSTKNSYTITWLNDDGTEIDHETLEYGATPEHVDIDKEATAEWTYTFAGWDPAIVDVIEDAFYKAQFDSVKNTYTITWLSNDGSEIDHASLEYGATPDHDDAVKEATAEWTYTFTGWDPAVVAVIGEATYTAQFDSIKNSYTITWLNEDGTEIDHETLEYGSTPTHADIIKENTDEWTYTFMGWEPEIATVTGDATYTAIIDSIKNTYSITWLNEDGSEIDKTTVEYGIVPTHDDPTKEATDEWTYNFTGWNPTVVAVVGEATYTATFDSIKNTYTITWLNDDNSLIDQTTEEFGATPTHDDAVKEATAEWTYSFTGWDPTITEVTGDATYTAQFDSTKNSYTITWLNEDGSEIEHETLEYGTMPSHADIDKENTDEWTYTFVGWTPEITTVTGDASYTATFDSVKNAYTITWLNWDNSLIDETTVEYGVVPTHDDPTKETTAEWTYTFTGWTPEIVAVIGDATYTAQFDSIKNSYTITWLNDDGTEIDHETLEYGSTPSHADIDKESTEDWAYTFTGWEPEITMVTGDATYTATFDSTQITIYYHVTVTTDDVAHGEAGFIYADEASSAWLTDSDVAEGTWIELRAIASDDWHFDHWSDGDTASVRQVEVTADMQFTAYFALNCGDYPTLPVVSLYDWLLMLDVRSIHAMGYTFAEEDVIWYRVNGAPDKESDGAKADDERVGTGYSFTLNESLVNSGDYYATVDVSSSPAGTLCSGMMRSQIVHFASSRAAAPPMLTPALVRPNEPQHILRLDPEFPTTVTIYDLSGHLLRTFSEEGVDRMDLQAESVAGSYQVVVQNGDLRTVLRYIVVQ